MTPDFLVMSSSASRFEAEVCCSNDGGRLSVNGEFERPIRSSGSTQLDQ
jgi:hypothetical protein